MKKNKIKWYSYMAFILSSPYLLESCANSINSSMVKKQNDDEISTKKIEKPSDESNNLTENKEESSPEESDNGFQNSDPYADLSKAVNYKNFRGFIKDCKKHAEKNNERRYFSEDYYTDDDYYENDFSKIESYKDFVLYLLQEKSSKDFLQNLLMQEKDSLQETFPKIFADINTEISKTTPDSSNPQNIEDENTKYKEEDLSKYTNDEYITSMIGHICDLEKGDSLLLRKESYDELFDLSNQGTQKKKICNRKNITLEKDNSIVESYESWDDVAALYIEKIKFKILVCHITEENYILKVTKL